MLLWLSILDLKVSYVFRYPNRNKIKMQPQWNQNEGVSDDQTIPLNQIRGRDFAAMQLPVQVSVFQSLLSMHLAAMS